MVVLPLMNIATLNRAFIADPFEQFCALRRLQSHNWQLLAIYHSHPGGGVDPSPEDLVYARRWSCIHLIVAVGMHAEFGERLRAFRCDELGSIEEVEIRLLQT
jgi:proteasome lid subunit RPN8/RPN11